MPTGDDGRVSVDPESPDYIWRQVADLIAERIRQGVYTSRLPSEGALAQEFGIGRNTVRHAVEDLRDRGLVITVPQRGTFVKRG